MNANAVADGIALFFERAILGCFIIAFLAVAAFTMGLTIYVHVAALWEHCQRGWAYAVGRITKRR